MRHRWHNGLRPDNYPNATLLGSAECIELGDVRELATPWITTASPGSSAVATYQTIEVDFPFEPGQVVQTGTAERTYTLSAEREIAFSLNASAIPPLEAQPWTLDVRLAVDDETAAEAVLSYPVAPGSLVVMWNGRFSLPAGEHTVSVSAIRNAPNSPAALHCQLLLEFNPPFTYDQGAYQEGFQTSCYLPTPPFPTQRYFLPDIQKRADQVELARVENLLYISLHDAEVAAQELLGPVTLSSVPNSASFYPGSIIAQGPLGTVVWFSGTTTYQQFALQAAAALAGPFSFGPYGTTLAWLQASNRMLDRMLTAAVDPALPLIIVGHSFGGAIGALVAARLRLGNPDRRIDLLTFGMPVPGDTDLARLLDQTRHLHLANVGDAVPSLPPQALSLAYLGNIVSPLLFYLWKKWEKPLNQLLLDVDGATRETQEDTVQFPELAATVLLLVLGVPVPAIPAHSMQTYLNRLLA